MKKPKKRPISRPKIRSRIPPPGFVIDKSSYRRTQAKKRLEKELEEYQREKKNQSK